MHNTKTQLKAEPRNPVVVVLGHIDHGKTTLLDTIRKTNITAKESGGITQHLSAYEVLLPHGKKITFLDTPGHETFSKMRARGARVADIAILVVAADDGVKPQTKEALNTIREAGIPFVVALNKADKPTSDIDRAKSQLAEAGVLVEGWGGTVPVVAISAKEGTGVDDLLETVLLMAELAELSGDPNLPGVGVVIESYLDSRRGPSATLLITNGTVRKGTFVRAGDAVAPVRILENTRGESIDEAGPSTPIVIAGFTFVPPVGMPFESYTSKAEAEERARDTEAVSQQVASSAEVGIMIKADVLGSYEALSDQIQKIVPPDLAVKFFRGGVGDIGEADVKTMAAAKTAFIIGFRARVKPAVKDLAERFRITVRTFDIIYEAVDWVREEFTKLVPKKVVREDVGKLVVLKVFSSSQAGRIIGGRVKSGRVPAGRRFEGLRGDDRVCSGSIKSLQKNKAPIAELREGDEGGLLVDTPKAIEERDTLQFYYEREG